MKPNLQAQMTKEVKNIQCFPCIIAKAKDYQERRKMDTMAKLNTNNNNNY